MTPRILIADDDEDAERRKDEQAADTLYRSMLERQVWEDAGERAERLLRAWDKPMPEGRLDPGEGE